MTVAVVHRLVTLLTAATGGPGGTAVEGLEVVGRPPGACSAVVVLAGHSVIAADVPDGWVRERLPRDVWSDDEHHPALNPHFLAALSARIGAPPAGVSTLLSSAGPTPRPGGVFTPVADIPPGWSDYRSEVRTFRYRGTTGSGAVTIGRGPGGRWDTWIELDESAQRSPALVRGRELLEAARSLVPAAAPLFVSVPVHAARSLRTAVSAGFEPIGAEVLFHTED